MRGPIIAIVLGLAMLGCGLVLLFAQRAEEQSERSDMNKAAIADAPAPPTEAPPKPTAEELREAEANRLQKDADFKAWMIRDRKKWELMSMCAGGLGPRDDAAERQVLGACMGAGYSDAELEELRTPPSSPTPYIVFCGEVWPEETISLSCFDRDERVDDLAALVNLPYLSDLYLSTPRVADIGPLADLGKLHRLRVHSRSLQDIAPLSSLVNLHHLDLGGTAVRDIGPLESLQNLRLLGVRGLDIPQGQIRSIQSALPKLKVVGP